MKCHDDILSNIQMICRLVQVLHPKGLLRVELTIQRWMTLLCLNLIFF